MLEQTEARLSPMEASLRQRIILEMDTMEMKACVYGLTGASFDHLVSPIHYRQLKCRVQEKTQEEELEEFVNFERYRFSIKHHSRGFRYNNVPLEINKLCRMNYHALKFILEI
ncbi:hypothetical protein HHK36_030925 [Tetracentron sinense]|uniref:Uncharacterized protein n=1 Tax=Tetracentron sinense TaxID=13715 RepID=A0A834Y8G9_TETSI|nr:hypothetical protein HHK36_030925 [Tetracentron sinense]